MFKSKLVGGMLFIVGTSIGGGMLVLPVSIATVGFVPSLLFLVACWAVMTCGALLLLEVNLRLPVGSNLVSMAKSTLGLPGQVVAWVAYLLLLYTLLSAYISGGGDLVFHALMPVRWHPSYGFSALLFTVVLGMVIYQGMRTVDQVNRVLMLGKLGVYALLVLIICPHIDTHHYHGGSLWAITGSLMLFVTSFGFASIVPTLSDYFAKDAKLLKKAIVFGSLIPLVCYVIWITVIMGVIDRSGPHGLLALKHAKYTISGLMSALHTAADQPWISGLFAFFTTVCMLTAFLGVSIGLFDFLADGLNLRKSGKEGGCLLLLTFLPPLIMVVFFPGLYLSAFAYAGVCCVILLLLLPIMMAWKARDTNPTSGTVILPIGKSGLVGLGVIGVVLLLVALYTMG